MAAVWTRIVAALRSSLLQNVLVLYGTHAANLLLPLLTVPYLARVMGPPAYGVVAIAQAFSVYVGMVVEYGFNYSATREVARVRDDAARMRELLAGVLGARLALATLALAATALMIAVTPALRDQPALGWVACWYGIVAGLSPTWYYQGMEQLRTSALLEMGSRVAATAGIFVLVRGPADSVTLMLLYALCGTVATGVALALMYRRVRPSLPSPRGTWESLRLGWTMFLFRGAASLYTAGNALILSFFVAPQLVAYYAGAEKIAKAAIGLLSPVSQALYPRISRLTSVGGDAAARLARTMVVVMTLLGFGLSAALFVAAPLAVRILLGPGFEPAVPVLRVLSLLPVLLALSNVFGIQWMLPLGLDRAFNTIIVCAGLLNLALALLLAPRFSAAGMAWSVVIAEAFVTAVIYLVLRLRNLDPLTQGYAPARSEGTL